MCFWTLLSLQLITGACPRGFGINNPRGGLKGEMAERAVVDMICWWEEIWEVPCGAAQFPLGTDLVPSANLSVGKRDVTQFPGGGTGAEV